MARLAPLTTRLFPACALAVLLQVGAAGAAAELVGPAPTPVILIVVDTLRADRLGTYGYARFTSPELDAYARQGAVFQHAFAPSPWTLPTFGSLFTGLWPVQHGAGALATVGKKVLYAQLRADPPTLAERLRAHGYLTYAIAGNPNLHPKFGVARGFDKYDFRAGDMATIRRADVIVDRAIAWLHQRRGAPFFLFLHFFDPHMNYDPPPPVRGRFTAGLPSGRLTLPFAESLRVRAGRLRLTGEEQAFVSAAYDEEIAFVDLQLGRLFAALHRQGLWGRAIIIFTSDHGEELWDHGGFEHGHTLYDELVRAPLLVWGPGVRSGRIATPVSLVDLAPTILDAVGAEPLADAPGLSLWPLLTAGAALPERELFAESPRYGAQSMAVIRWPYKAVVDLESGDQHLFDLAADPTERADLRAARNGTMAQLRRDIDHRVATFKKTPPTPAAVTLDAATREQLRALGYLE